MKYEIEVYCSICKEKTLHNFRYINDDNDYIWVCSHCKDSKVYPYVSYDQKQKDLHKANAERFYEIQKTLFE